MWKMKIMLQISEKKIPLDIYKVHMDQKRSSYYYYSLQFEFSLLSPFLTEFEQNNIINNQMRKYNNGKKSIVPSFIEKLFSLVEKYSNQQILRWGLKSGSFEILDVMKFSEQILPQYFNHHNMQTFIRQLYNYEFKKLRIQNIDHCYFHKNFLKDKPDEMKKIKRKKYQNVQDSEEQSYQAIQSEIEEIQSLREKQNQFSLYMQQSMQKLNKMKQKNIQLMDNIIKEKKKTNLLENVLQHYDAIHQSESSYNQISRQSSFANVKYLLEKIIDQSYQYEYLSSIESPSNFNDKNIYDAHLNDKLLQRCLPILERKGNNSKVTRDASADPDGEDDQQIDQY